MKEDFLHFIWKFKLFNTLALKTTSGEDLTVLSAGNHNVHSGQDFTQAEIRIGDTRWVGNVEIHVQGSDWYRHRHQDDPAYKNTILHVVYQNDKEAHLFQNGDLPVLELREFIPEDYELRYNELLRQKGWIPCDSQFPSLEQIKVNQWLDHLVVERLQRKSRDILNIYLETGKDWNETFYRWLARSFGFKINSEAFHRLAEITPIKILKKHANSLFQVEALLFGQAGLLEQTFHDKYAQELQQEYQFLSKKYQLIPMSGAMWKFARTMPSNFPTKRIAQLAAFMCAEQGTFSKIIAFSRYVELKGMLQSRPSDYWLSHYRFDAEASSKSKGSMGNNSADGIIINSVATMLYAYGQKTEQFELIEQAVTLLEDSPAERNSIISNWKKLQVIPRDAKQSQALIELKRENCEKKKCLSCLFGMELIKANNTCITQ